MQFKLVVTTTLYYTEQYYTESTMLEARNHDRWQQEKQVYMPLETSSSALSSAISNIQILNTQSYAYI